MTNVTRDRLIEEAVEALIIENGMPKRDMPPVPVERIAEFDLGLHCEVRSLEDHGPTTFGLLIPQEKTIVIDGRCNESQYSFTIAHEIGHWMLHVPDNANKSFVDNRNDLTLSYQRKSAKSLKRRHQSPLEAEANQFAAALLIPYKVISPTIRQVGFIDESVIRELASTYRTSLLTMMHRLAHIESSLNRIGVGFDWKALDTLEKEIRGNVYVF